jgi:hypothetical protein
MERPELSKEQHYEMIAIKLRENVKNYIPQSWKETIGTVDHVPFFLADDAEHYEASFEAGSLRKELKEEYGKKWYMIEAIASFFEEGKDKM